MKHTLRRTLIVFLATVLVIRFFYVWGKIYYFVAPHRFHLQGNYTDTFVYIIGGIILSIPGTILVLILVYLLCEVCRLILNYILDTDINFYR